MKLTIKTLQQLTFKVDIEPDKTVKDLKEQIENEHGKDYPNGAQKLIYSGKILADDSKLSEYNIDEKKFIVLMITRPPPPPKPLASEKTPSSSSVKIEESKSRGADDKAGTKAKTSSTNATVSTPTTAATTTSTPAQPVRTSARPSTLAPSNAAASNEASVLSAMSEPQMANRLAMLMSQPQFRQIQDLIQQSPHLLSSTIEALAGSDPEMYNFISENPDIFVSALNHPPLAGNRSQTDRNTSSDHQQARSGHPQQASRQQGGVEHLIDVSEHDKEAIERLKELGFSEYLAVQAYMACDKDEQLAANLLFQMDQ